MTRPSKSRLLRTGLIGLGAILLLGACEPRTALRGNLPRESQMEQIRVGQDSKSRVRDILGTPSTVGTFDQDVWYYMSQKTEQWAFFEPEIVDHQILALYFDANGRLENMVTYTEEDLREVDYASRTTPTSGREFTFIEQMFGNLNRFR
ncbi:outer membrane protein assembly factor BamE [Marivibrio halodurans]|uniref:Outer membrane protein assembly factor BamE n=1 Tax=Marivibrio halodurans TaxID=2039722 RepID=A0A8J7SGK3_9PROT|nr:outer membrane protein assembly factor BamE [Marivibrio halodurans]MBP5855788.1 outer membrane protein assembly factor BamE [Marivibrio halodurans]